MEGLESYNFISRYMLNHFIKSIENTEPIKRFYANLFVKLIEKWCYLKWIILL